MTRFAYANEMSDVDEIRAYGRWKGATLQALKSKRGQQALADLEAALLALPDHQLLAGGLVNDAAFVCAIGALARYKGVPLWSRPELDTDEQEEETLAIGAACGLTESLTSLIAHENDDWHRASPYVRWPTIARPIPTTGTTPGNGNKKPLASRTGVETRRIGL